jgi:2,3,4,5-tetrahydropyridine-2-carboxylate N-succinyltransferase
MSFIGIGFRRKRTAHVLDVWYPVIHDLYSLANHSLTHWNDTPEGITELSPEAYSEWQKLYFPTLPKKPPLTNPYADTDILCFKLIDHQSPIQSTEDAYFRLQLLSQRLVKPHTIGLTNLFHALPTLAWTNYGPILPDDVPMCQWHSTDYPLTVSHVDKFPYMVNYHIPSGVRIAKASSVRLGAYLGHGTTVMPSGFINFNAGTLGTAMVEGRVSAGVVIGDQSDVGGGASIMGTLSGGNNHVISVGSHCLLGANSGIGISLGDGCTVEAGLYLTASKKITLLDDHNNPVDSAGNPVGENQNVVKAMTLSGCSSKVFFNHSQRGHVICKPNTKYAALNTTLHVNH